MSQLPDSDILAMIRCPVTHSRLAIANQETLDKLNEKVSKRELIDRNGQKVTEKVESGLVNQDDSLLLPIRQGIIVLISGQAIPLKK